MVVLLREILGETLRSRRLAQQRTLREVSSAARVSLGYLSEVERGQKEASSELLAAICEALGTDLPDLLRAVGDEMADAQRGFRQGSVQNRRVLRAVPAREREQPDAAPALGGGRRKKSSSAAEAA